MHWQTFPCPGCFCDGVFFQVVDVELHRDTLVDDYIPLTSSSKVAHRVASPVVDASQSFGHSSSHNVAGTDKGKHGTVRLSEQT